MSGKDRRLVALFEDDVATRYAERTREHYLADLKLFLAWLEPLGLELKDVRPTDVQRYQGELYALRKKNGQPYAVATIALRLIAVQVFFRFLMRRGYLLFDPSSGLEVPAVEKKLPRVILSEAEAKRIVTAPRSTRPMVLRDRAILETLYGTGLRVNELIHIKPAHVDVEDRTLRIVHGKGGKDRNVPLTTAAARAIARYVAAARMVLAQRHPGVRWLFFGGRGHQLDRSRVNKIVKRWAGKAGVTKRVSCHTFRHSIATHLLRGRADIRQIQALLGHADLSTTERYTHVAITDLKSVVERAHPRGR